LRELGYDEAQIALLNNDSNRAPREAA